MRRLILPLIAVFAIDAGQAHPQAPPSGSTLAATVNGEPITLAELDGVLETNLQRIPLTVAQRKQLRSSLLNDMIDDRLLKQFLAKNGPKVDPEELDAQLKAFTAELQKEHQTLAQYLRKTGLTEAQLRADWTAAIQLTNYVQQRATDEQLRAYHAANRDHFDKVEVRIAHLVIRVNKAAPPGEQVGSRDSIHAIRADIVAGKLDFAAAVRKYSQAENAKTGGDEGFVRRRGPELEEALLKAAFALKVGEISPVIETSSGLHLITVTERKPGTPSTVEKSIVEVLEAYTEDFRTDLIARLRKEGQIRILLP